MSIELTGLEGKVAIVTGAGRMRSIGRPIAVALARAGCDVVLTGTGRAPGRYPEDEQRAGWRDIESVAEEIRALGRRALAVVSDVADAAAVEALLGRVTAEFDGVDVLVNNAGATRGTDRVPIVDLKIDEWHRVLATNLHGTFYMSRASAQRMVARGRGGSIVNISSLAARLMAAETGVYSASKAAINALSTVMSAELGPNRIRVNAICPGIIDTNRLDDVGRGALWQSYLESFVPLGRAGTGEDVANLVAFLCSDQGAWITGQHIYVDGGHSSTPRRQK
ncbi:MAG: 3-oxoacyl-[acyl-carrier-protein] reductase FabG [Steroidobacteraceae bacterium]|nr:3-oxoacyl-[acyl-carrier-protein] reductase FabG [Steroidobacteraceae bacterium]